MTAPLALGDPIQTMQYGSFVFGEANGIILSSEYEADDTNVFGSFYAEFNVRLATQTGNDATDDASFAALVAAAEAACKLPRQRLRVWHGASPFRDWNFAPSGSDPQTAIMLEPELRLIEENRRDYRYGFRVRCQFPGQVSGNFFRRESLSQVGSSNRLRRTLEITGTWTSGTTSGTTRTAYAQYLAVGGDFFDAQLALVGNKTDQHSITGSWILADERGGPWNDEDSIIQPTRVYWEVFHGRRDSQVRVETLPNLSSHTYGVSKFLSRRMVRIPSTWASSGSNTALANYLDNGGAFFDAALPSNVSSGEWVLIDADPTTGDSNDVLYVTHTYAEVVDGLWDLTVEVQANEVNARTATISGTYYATASHTAKTNFDNGVSTLVSTILGTLTGVWDGVAAPRYEGYGTTALQYHFRYVLHEIVYGQGSSADDGDVLFEWIDLKVRKPFDLQTTTGAISVTRLKTCIARFIANINTKSSGGLDPTALWVGSLRAHVIAAVTAKLGSDVTSVQVVDEEVGPLIGDQSNRLTGTLWCIVTGGSVLALRMGQRILQIPGRQFVSRGDGTKFSYYPYRRPPRKLLRRWAICEYVVGGSPPALFATGDQDNVSGFGFIDTGVNAQDSIDAQNDTGTLDFNAWFIDGDSGEPYVFEDEPTDRGDGGSAFQTVVHKQVENWLYMEALEPGVSLE